MKILPVTDPSFRNYGQVLTGYDLKELLDTLDKVTPCPDGVDYVPEQPELQALPIERTCGTTPTAACRSRSAGATAITRR